MRGNLASEPDPHRRPRSIPACAGEPARRAAFADATAVYPRVCGGTSRSNAFAAAFAGLSPRVRGNRVGAPQSLQGCGSIPACAGEPLARWANSSPWAVYPRVCGGTRGRVSQTPATRGLSPRVRGNPAGALDHILRGGSIPACAGEPSSWRPHSWCPTVYPRVCGGTAAAAFRDDAREGLSPRVRGNRRIGCCSLG